MKTSRLIPVFAAAMLGMLAQSCSEEPLYTGADGLLKLKMIVDSEVTRAEVDDESLAEKCVVYISDTKGLLHKFQGLQNVPEDLWLKSGNYVAEAWTGDSVSASFDKKFYRGYQPFEIQQGVNNVVLTCKIANVVASVNTSAIAPDLLQDWTITIGNTADQLVFDEDKVADGAKGYFMQPNGDNDLSYTIQGRNIAGTEFTKTGVIENVQRAHEYVLNLKFNPDGSLNDVGGAFITITVDDTSLLIEDEITLHAAPRIEGLGTDIDAPIAGSMGSFSDLYLGAVCYGNPSALSIKFSDAAAFGMDYAEYNLLNLAEPVEAELAAKGVKWTTKTEGEHTQVRLNFSQSIFNHLPNGSYVLTVTLGDKQNRLRVKNIAIEVSDSKVIALPVDPADIRSFSALVKLTQVDDEATNPGIRFRRKGTTEWTQSTVTRATDLNFRLTGLAPSTTYEYQAVADGFVENKVLEFTTEAAFAIPNASFEDWSTSREVVSNKDVPFPGTGSTRSFWDSGNHGSMSMNKSVTNKATSPVHSGTYSVCLQSQFVGIGAIGKFAAGNLFAGAYMKTDGTDGELSFGRPMVKCHPVSLKGYFNYRPGTVEYSETSLLPKGQMDQGSVYVAVTTRAVDVKTKSKELFDKNADYVLAYGEYIFNGNFGADGSLAELNVPLTWKNAAYTGQYYIVIVAAASRYGDYFTGGSSVMYIDDLQLIYE